MLPRGVIDKGQNYSTLTVILEPFGSGKEG